MTEQNAIDIAAPILNPEPAPEVVTAPTVVPEEKQITMSQSQLDALIKSRQSSSLKKAAAAEAELARVKAITVGSAESATEIEKLRAEISLEQQRSAAAEARAVQQEKAVLLARLGQEIDAIDPTSVGKLLASEIVARDGKFVVVDEAGVERVNVDGTPVTPQQHYKTWAADHLWGIKGRVLSGGGGTSSSGSSTRVPVTEKPLNFYFGSGSNAAAVNALSIQNPALYKKLRRDAVAAGILPRSE